MWDEPDNATNVQKEKKYIRFGSRGCLLSRESTSEFYSVLLNRSTGKNMIMYSTEGGMDIETVAEETPHLIFTEIVKVS